MSGDCQASAPPTGALAAYRRSLWLVFGLNGAMFLIEGAAGLVVGSVSLQADALDFLGDAATYAITLYVLARSLRWRASAGLLKGATMSLFGVAVVASGVYRALAGGVPEALVMAPVAGLALIVNLASAMLLFRHRSGDSNRRSAWLCSRNDALANIAVIVAAAGVAWSGAAWPDLVVGAAIAALALSSGVTVVRQAVGELRTTA